MNYFFFFQAEDGIRDGHVTGVQTCALPISVRLTPDRERATIAALAAIAVLALPTAVTQVFVIVDRKSTRLNSSHVAISYAVFCLKKKSCFCFSLLYTACNTFCSLFTFFTLF